MHNLSVIVTTYNRPSLLNETIKSILNQTFVDFELIVVDNFSNYNFFELIKSYNDKRIKAFQNQNNGVIAANRNYGIKKASGKFIAFCDDDDIWVENKLDVQMNIIKKKKIDFISSNMFLFKSKIEDITGLTKNRLVTSFNDFLSCNQINTSTVIAKKSSILKFNESNKLVSIEDFELWLKLYLNNYKFYFINKPLVYYRLSSHNMSFKNYAHKHLRLIYLMNIFLTSNSKEISYFTLKKIIFINYLKYYFKKIIGFIKH
tara:strand:- start:191 stop:970 length:780 start_codon:yes stop_codon:yes gene_type:complete